MTDGDLQPKPTMKGTIVKCLEELVRKDFGDDKWSAVMERSGIEAGRVFSTMEDVSDETVLAMIGATAEVLGITPQVAMDAFGMHWSKTYAPKVYGVFFEKAKSAREFLLSLDGVHDTVTRRMENARPPRFVYDDQDPSKLTMRYESPRGLVALMPGLVKGVGALYGEEVDVSLVGNEVRIHFKSISGQKAA